MDENDLDLFIKYIKEKNRRLPSGGVLEGIPGKDKRIEEIEIARQFAQEKFSCFKEIIHEPNGSGSIPDIEIKFHDESSILLEITKFVDQDIRENNANISRYLSELNITNQQYAVLVKTALDRAYDDVNKVDCGEYDNTEFLKYFLKYHPLPETLNKDRFKLWSSDEILQKINHIIDKKSKKLKNEQIEAILIIYVTERTITNDDIRSVVQNNSFNTKSIIDVYLLCDYSSSYGGYEAFKLKRG